MFKVHVYQEYDGYCIAWVAPNGSKGLLYGLRDIRGILHKLCELLDAGVLPEKFDMKWEV